MKSLLKLAVILLAVVAINACKSGGDNPEAVAEKFLNHLAKKEYAEAKALGTEGTVQMISMMESMGAMGGEATEEETPKFENIKVEVDGEKGVCTYTADGDEETMDMVKVEGAWKVDMKKETPVEPEVEPEAEVVDTTVVGEAVEGEVPAEVTE